MNKFEKFLEKVFGINKLREKYGDRFVDSYKKGGINPSPKTKKPKIKLVGQGTKVKR